MKKQLFSLMFILVLFILLFSFPMTFAQEDNSGSNEDNSGGLDNNEDRDNSGSSENSDDGGLDNNEDRDNSGSSENSDDGGLDNNEDRDNSGSSEKSEFKTRTRSITRGDETFTITQTKELTRTINEDGSNTEVKVKITEVVNEDGKVVKRIVVEKMKDKFLGENNGSVEIEVETELEVEEETEDGEKKIKIKLSNEERRELKVLPDEASDIAKERLRIRNLTKFELREVTHKNVPAVVYYIEAGKQGRFLGIFKFSMKVETEIDPETGEVITTNKPWWAFLVIEKDEIPEENIDGTGDETICSDLSTEILCSERTDCQNVFNDDQLWIGCEEVGAQTT